MSQKISDPKNISLLIVFGILATIYGPQFLPNIPKPIIDLFKTKWFRAVVIFLAIFLAQKDIVLSIVITTIFLIIINIIQNKVLLETFLVNYNQNIEGFLDLSNLTSLNRLFHDKYGGGDHYSNSKDSTTTTWRTNSDLIQQNEKYVEQNPGNHSTSYNQYTGMCSGLKNTFPKIQSQAVMSNTLSPTQTHTPTPKQSSTEAFTLENFKNKTDTDLNSFPLSNCQAYNPVNLNLIGTSYYPINPTN